MCQAEQVLAVALAATTASAAAWLYLLAGHGGFWRTSQRLPQRAGQPAAWPAVTAIVPARNEAAMLPATLPSLLGQAYPGELTVVLVDDNSSDGTAAVATAVAASANAAIGRGPPKLQVIPGRPLPAGWAGKVWAMQQGVPAAQDGHYLLFTDADIEYAPGSVAALVRAAVTDDRALLSQLALLRAERPWERWLVPAFAYFFAQLYPFRRVNRPTARTAAAAGGCMLVRAAALATAGGLGRIRSARIDDVALGKLIKSQPGSRRCWLGYATDVRSLRPYPGLAELWLMIARSAYTQLRYSPLALAGTIGGLLWLYLLPPVAALAGLAVLAGRGGAPADWLAAAGFLAWAVMSVTYLPVLRLYRLSPLRAPCLPLIAVLYAAMTADSARRHRAGRGGEWKGRTV